MDDRGPIGGYRKFWPGGAKIIRGHLNVFPQGKLVGAPMRGPQKLLRRMDGIQAENIALLSNLHDSQNHDFKVIFSAMASNYKVLP